MNTPAHAIAGLLLLGSGNRQRHAVAIVAGSLVPDAPMLIFYLWARFSGMSERSIWREGYFDPGWQAFFDAFHSFPLLAFAALFALWMRMKGVAVFFAAMVLHSVFDFPLHHHDAHRHFWPLSDYRFASPLSYWDPQYYGQWVGPLELLMVVAGGAWLLRHAENPAVFRSVAAILLLYLSFWGFAAAVWL